ncbi:helix-turn-helix domain-containing protein [Saccharicrinis aurantiacus]|uniref:helix-turn-helix domain-containing protein n=1 Tax=Saccharicrinis aurantiacus TaxID=1849719 RepID=UPI0008390107|nr:helix-turn-helix domain-containing protein [Saccharicrinis aurantiacus]
MKTKKIKVNGISQEIEVSMDGKHIIYKDKEVHQSLVKPNNSRNGFYQVSIESKILYVHRLVAQAFIRNEKPVSYKMVLHINCVTTDNSAENLEWGDFKKLAINREKQGLSGAKNLDYRGKSTISYEEALKIAKRLDAGEFAKDISKEYNVSEMSIARIRKRYCEKKSASPRYTEDVKKNIVKLLEKHPTKRVAEISGIPYETVYKWKRKFMNN